MNYKVREFRTSMNYMKSSYWSELLDELQGAGIPVPSTRMSSTRNHALEKSHENELLEWITRWGRIPHHQQEWGLCKIARTKKTSYWSVILDELQGAGIPHINELYEIELLEWIIGWITRCGNSRTINKNEFNEKSRTREITWKRVIGVNYKVG